MNIDNWLQLVPAADHNVVVKAKSPRDMPVQYVFIVDKDYDDLLGNIENVPDLFYWDRYCIENYLLHGPSIGSICVERRPNV